jgi:hypothetical protein
MRWTLKRCVALDSAGLGEVAGWIVAYSEVSKDSKC